MTSTTNEDLFRRVDALAVDYCSDPNLRVAALEAANAATPDDPDVVWRLVQALAAAGYPKGSTPGDKRCMALREVELARRAVELAPTSPHAHKWLGLALMRFEDFEPLQAKVGILIESRNEYMKAIELGGDPMCCHYLGQLIFVVTDIPWVLRMAAKALVKENLPTTTFEQALEMFEKFEALAPRSSRMNALFLARCLVKLKRNNDAKDWLNTCLAIPRSRPAEREDDLENHVRKMLKSL